MDRYQITLHPSKEPYERFPEKVIREMLSTPEGKHKLSESMRQSLQRSLEEDNEYRRRTMMAALGIPANYI